MRGSVLQQPDSEFYDTSKKNVEKYLIKWAHASYLHVSWETEKDIIDLVGSIAKVRTYAPMRVNVRIHLLLPQRNTFPI
jgi:Chromo (CHRromatin Organisation MOdifier) domain